MSYSSNYNEAKDTEGLSVFKWQEFDSVDKFGSGKYFMESEPVAILDAICKKNRIKPRILLGYTSDIVANKLKLSSDNPHRLGKAIKLECLNKKKRMTIVSGLIMYGIERIRVSDDWISFDTDSYIKDKELVIF